MGNPKVGLKLPRVSSNGWPNQYFPDPILAYKHNSRWFSKKENINIL